MRQKKKYINGTNDGTNCRLDPWTTPASRLKLKGVVAVARDTFWWLVDTIDAAAVSSVKKPLECKKKNNNIVEYKIEKNGNIPGATVDAAVVMVVGRVERMVDEILKQISMCRGRDALWFKLLWLLLVLLATVAGHGCEPCTRNPWHFSKLQKPIVKYVYPLQPLAISRCWLNLMKIDEPRSSLSSCQPRKRLMPMTQSGVSDSTTSSLHICCSTITSGYIHHAYFNLT